MNTELTTLNLDIPRQLLVNGRWSDAADGSEFETINPATGELIATVAHAGRLDADRAVKAARHALDEGPWPKMTPAERGRIISKLGDLLLQNVDDLALLETLDQGKPLSVASSIDIPSAASLFHYMSGWCTKLTGETIPISVPGEFHTYTVREPVGVVALIVPWNFPLAIAAWKVAPALAAGNTIILKPAEQTPLTALRLGELALEAGVPPGVLNVLPGYGESVGVALVEHPGVDKVSFTGSTETGRSIVKASAGNLKRVSLELGGKSANIVFDDADLSKAIAGSSVGVFANAGQACAAASRMYVHENVLDEFVAGISEQAAAFVVGDGRDPASQIGPLISQEQLDRVGQFIDLADAEGVHVASGGRRIGEQGYFLEPTVLTKVSHDSALIQEEIFGPVVAITPFSDVSEVVRLANDTSYGLAAGVWSTDVRTIHRVAARLKAGTVWANCYQVFDAAMPYGGVKQSGWGREMGKEVLDLFTETKVVCVDIAD